MPTETEKLLIRLSPKAAASRLSGEQPDSPPLETHPVAMGVITEAYSNRDDFLGNVDDEAAQPSGS